MATYSYLLNPTNLMIPFSNDFCSTEFIKRLKIRRIEMIMNKIIMMLNTRPSTRREFSYPCKVSSNVTLDFSG